MGLWNLDQEHSGAQQLYFSSPIVRHPVIQIIPARDVTLSLDLEVEDHPY